MNFIVVSIFISVILVSSLATKMSSCSTGGNYPTNASYSINSYMCDQSPCICILGCESIISVDFQAPRYLEKIKPKVHAAAEGVELDFPLGQDDACEGITNTQCPLVKNEKVNYKYALTIPAILPEVTVTLKFSIVDEELNENVICFEWDINVKRASCPA